MTVVCSYCNAVYGTKPGQGTTHGICPKCQAYPREKLDELARKHHELLGLLRMAAMQQQMEKARNELSTVRGSDDRARA